MCDEVMPVYFCDYGVFNAAQFALFDTATYSEDTEGVRTQVILEKMEVFEGNLRSVDSLTTDIRAVIALGYYNRGPRIAAESKFKRK